MKARFIAPVIVLLVVGAPSTFAQPVGDTRPQNMPNTQQMDQRFQRMNTMMGQANGAHGAQLMALMQRHMLLMQEQMQAMHSMMGGGMMGGMDGGRIGAIGMMNGNGVRGAAGGNANIPSQMQRRMDMIQQMMEPCSINRT